MATSMGGFRSKELKAASMADLLKATRGASKDRWRESTDASLADWLKATRDVSTVGSMALMAVMLGGSSTESLLLHQWILHPLVRLHLRHPLVRLHLRHRLAHRHEHADRQLQASQSATLFRSKGLFVSCLCSLIDWGCAC